ncbi:MAG: Zn-dependent hydrolase [Tepidanaerobacteraceae bacterium]
MVAGVVSALELLRIMKENNIDNYYPVEIAVMNNEEGVRFGIPVSNSRAMVGLIEEGELDNIKDKDGISLRKAIIDFGITPNLANAKRTKNSIKAFIELHIEQGPVLEHNNKKVGIEETIVGFHKYSVKFMGQSGHAGTTPMANRKDALVAASEFILAVNNVVKEVGLGTVGTVGELNLTPNASNVIPNYVQLSVDIRSTENDNLQKSYEKLVKEIETIKKQRNVDIEMKRTLRIDPVYMSKEMIDIMECIANKLNLPYMRMNSGAIHDAMVMANIAPAAMIFVPSKGGLSHHPDEWTEYIDLKRGIELMLYTLLELCKRG